MHRYITRATVLYLITATMPLLCPSYGPNPRPKTGAVMVNDRATPITVEITYASSYGGTRTARRTIEGYGSWNIPATNDRVLSITTDYGDKKSTYRPRQTSVETGRVTTPPTAAPSAQALKPKKAGSLTYTPKVPQPTPQKKRSYIYEEIDEE